MFATVRNPAARGLVHAPVVADGGDITAVLNAYLPTVETGSTVVFPPNKTFTVSAPGIKCLTMQPGVSIDWNGTTLVPPAGFFHVAHQSVVHLATANTQVSATDTMTHGQTTYTAPAGIVPAIGDLFGFTTSTTVAATQTEVYRWMARVVEVSGQVVTLDTGAPDSVTLTSIRHIPMLGNHEPVVVSGLRIDMRACATLSTPIQFLVAGMVLEFHDKLRVRGVEVLGNNSACVGVQISHTIQPVVEDCSVSRFYALPMFQTGRLGYGLAVYDSSSLTVKNCRFLGNRHSISTGGFVPGAVTVEQCELTAEPSMVADMAPAFGVQIDVHEGHAGVLDVQDCTFHTGFAAAYARGRSLNFERNRVRFIDGAAHGVYMANERAHGSIRIAHNEFTNGGDGNRIATVPVVNVEILEVVHNRMNAGSVIIPGATIPNTINIGRIVVSDNIVPLCNRLVEFYMISTAANQIRHVDIARNRVSMVATSTDAIRIGGLVASTLIGRINIDDNIIDLNSSTAAYFARLDRLHAKTLRIRGNTVEGGSVTHGSGTNGLMLDAVSSADLLEISKNTIDTDCWVYSAAAHVMPYFQVTGNRIRRLIITENNATSPFGVGQWDVSHNKFGEPGWAGPGLDFRASSATFWSNAASMVKVNDNQFQTTGANGVIIGAGHTGNRFIFKDNQLGASTIIDNAGPYHSTWGNYTTAAQNGKGGTVARADGLYATALPTSGTWIIGDRVWRSNPTNAAGVNAGWLCVTAGTPGTWRAFGNTA